MTGTNDPADANPYSVRDMDFTTQHYLDQLANTHHLPPHLQKVANEFYILGRNMARQMRAGIERSTMLRHIRDAKDAAVRQTVSDTKQDSHIPAP